jgi:hypothetical protein
LDTGADAGVTTPSAVPERAALLDFRDRLIGQNALAPHPAPPIVDGGLPSEGFPVSVLLSPAAIGISTIVMPSAMALMGPDRHMSTRIKA